MCDADGETAAEWAAERGHDEIAALLTEQKFEPIVLCRLLSDEQVAAPAPPHPRVSPSHLIRPSYQAILRWPSYQAILPGHLTCPPPVSVLRCLGTSPGPLSCPSQLALL